MVQPRARGSAPLATGQILGEGIGQNVRVAGQPRPSAAPGSAAAPPPPVSTVFAPSDVLFSGTPAAPATPAPGLDTPRSAYAWLEALDGSGRRIPMTASATFVGRSDDCDIVLKDNTISRRHASLRAEFDGRVSISDLGSGNGVTVNGKRITNCDLANGDLLQLGELKFRFLGGTNHKAATAEPVDCSVFAPSFAAPGQTIAIQVSLHAPDRHERAQSLAQIFDPGATNRGTSALVLDLERGTRVDIAIDGGGLEIAEPSASVRWRGDVASCAFRARVPSHTAAASFVPIVYLATGGVPLGSVTASITVGAARGFASEAAETRAVRFRRAFVSYSSQDRSEVLKRLQTLEALRISFFADVLDLAPGEKWESQIKQEIESCDLFLLFWSQAALASPWVKREIDHARSVRQLSPASIPTIVPVVLDRAPPPPGFEDLHFNSPIWQIISGGQQ